MSAEAQRGSEIELHFCHRCGISIPQTDIDSGRARPVPGGFVCAGCVYERRDAQVFAESVVPRRPAPAPPPRPRREGTRILVVIALLYVVGATSFLLARELGREPPAAPPSDLARVDDLEALGTRVDQLDTVNRQAFADLKSNDRRQREDLSLLSGEVTKLNGEVTGALERIRARLEQVEAGVLATSRKVDVDLEDIKEALRELKELNAKLGAGAARTPEAPAASPPADSAPEEAGASEEDRERARLVQQYVEKLGDRSASNQTRYNAAVQLGDLKHPDAIPALEQALEEDSYDLVRRAAAWSLGMFGKDAVRSIPVLIDQIGGKEEYVGYMCERALGEITKAVMGKPVSFGFDPTMSSRQRKKVQKEWEEWWDEHKPQLLPD